jgi:hypothetical protein
MAVFAGYFPFLISDIHNGNISKNGCFDMSVICCKKLNEAAGSVILGQKKARAGGGLNLYQRRRHRGDN